MARRDVSVIATGRRYRLGRTGDAGVIWRKRPWGWRVVARYPLTDEGWRVASGQFAMWEPDVQQPFGTFLPEAVAPAMSDPTDNAPASSASKRSKPWRLPGWIWIIGAVVLLGATAGGLFAGRVVHIGSVSSRFPKGATARSPETTTTSPRPASTTTTSSPPAVGRGYLAADSTWVYFVQWTDTNGELRGTLHVLTTSGQPPTETVTSTTVPVSGTITGSTISLSIDYGAQQFGTLTPSGFTISFRLQSGLLRAVHFEAASTSEYNYAVGKLRAEVISVNTTAAAAQRQAAEETAIRTAASTVSTNIASLAASASGVATAAKQMAGDMQNVTDALGETKSALQADLARANARTATACYYAINTVAYDAANTVRYDAVNTVGYAAEQTVLLSAKQLSTSITTLRTSFAAYQSAQAKLPSYVPTNSPTQAEVTDAISKAEATVAAAISIANGYIDEANADVSTAYEYADQAINAEHCGAPPSAPSPVPHIT